VQFIIQQPGDSSYYADYGGMLIDADLVRAAGEPGRDILDELGPMVGLARMVNAESVKVIEDGSKGEARVRVEGPGAPLRLATGALENPDLVPELDLWISTDYVLKPDSHLLEVITTVENREVETQSLFIGDLGFISLEVVDRYSPLTGLEDSTEDKPWTMAIGKHNEVVLGILGKNSDLLTGTAGALLGSIGPVMGGSSPNFELEPGGVASWSRYLGVAADPAVLVGEWAKATERATIAMSGTVMAGGSPVAGARVHALNGAGEPVGMAFTGEDGSWAADFPEETVTTVVSGSGPEDVVDLPAQHGWYSPYAAEPRPDDPMTSGSMPFADGYGFSETSELISPGFLKLSTSDAKPAVARITPADGSDAPDRRLVSDSSRSRIGFIRDGELTIPLPPGSYSVVVYRGVREELYTGVSTISSKATDSITATLTPAYSIADVITGDPHNHASPSGDGDISMEERLITVAAHGVDVHFGTDHDHIADYRPLLAPLGLDSVLDSIIADEISPVLRGHFNSWPAKKDILKANHGAYRWWQGYQDTTEIFSFIRAQTDNGVIQANHPVGGSGMFSFADFDPSTGVIGNPSHWSADFDAMELLNSGDYADYLPSYLALINHGHITTPLGVSDSHGHTSGDLGASLTFFHTNGETTPEALVDAVGRQATVVSRGPYIDARINGEFAPGKLVSGEALLKVSVYAPSWMPVETLSLYQDGELLESLPCIGTSPVWCEASWTLSPAQDASFVVIAESSQPMQYAYTGLTPWALTAAILVDTGGDGWSSPLAALVQGL
jgi:hypothetical protein